jgi:hypothetical protein
MMNQGAEQLLVQSLIDRSRSQRSLVRLAMAFKAHRPDWGSQGTQVALGLTGFLSHINWNLETAEYLLADWVDDAEGRMDAHLLDVRLNQVQQLVDMIKRPRPFVLQTDPEHPKPDLAALLSTLANNGLSTRELHELTQADEVSAPNYLRFAGIELSEGQMGQVSKQWSQLRQLGVQDYFDALRHDHRDFHPEVLWYQVTRHISLMGYALDPSVAPNKPRRGRRGKRGLDA